MANIEYNLLSSHAQCPLDKLNCKKGNCFRLNYFQLSLFTICEFQSAPAVKETDLYNSLKQANTYITWNECNRQFT